MKKLLLVLVIPLLMGVGCTKEKEEKEEEINWSETFGIDCAKRAEELEELCQSDVGNMEYTVLKECDYYILNKEAFSKDCYSLEFNYNSGFLLGDIIKDDNSKFATEMKLRCSKKIGDMTIEEFTACLEKESDIDLCEEVY